MILLKRAKFSNFRCLRNVELSFSTDPQKKLSVIRAANGTGKTTVMSALTWGLFGDSIQSGTRGKGKTERLSPSDWNVETDGTEIEVQVELEVEVIDSESGVKSNFTIIRKRIENVGAPASVSRLEPELTVLQQKSGGSIAQSEPKLFLDRTLLPQALKDIFFFDGDSALRFIDQDDIVGRRGRVEEAIRKLLGMEILEQAEKHLEVAKTAILRKAATEVQGTAIAELIKAEISLNEELQVLNEKFHNLREDYGTLLDEKTKLEVSRDGILASGGGRKDELRQNLETTKKQLRSTELELDGSIRFLRQKLNAHQLLFQISEKFLKNTVSIFDDLETRKIIPNIFPEILKDTLSKGTCICGADVTEGTTGHKHIGSILGELDHQTAAHGTLLNLSQSLRSGMRQTVPGPMNWVNVVQENQRTIADLRSRCDALRLRREAIQEELIQIPEANLQMVLNRIKELELSIQKKFAEQRVLENSITTKQEALAKNTKEMEQIDSKNKKFLQVLASQHAAEDLMLVVKNTLSHLKSETIDEVSKKMNDLFLQMIANVEGTGAINGVELSRDFDISVIGPLEERYGPAGYLNGASRRALTVAFIIALIQVSGQVAMTVVDTPLGMADGNVRRALLSTLISESVQPILFLTYSEILGIEDLLDDSVGRACTMTNSQHYPAQLANPLKTSFNEVFICDCNHRQMCKICERKVI